MQGKPALSLPAASNDITHLGQPAQRPRYVAIIADGHRRWSSRCGVSIPFAYNKGADRAIERVSDAAELGIRELTLFCFSVDNLRRPAAEVRDFMDIAERRIAQDAPALASDGVQIRRIGDREGLPARLAKRMAWAEELTAANSGLRLFVAFNYGGRQEIEEAARRLAEGGGGNLREHLYAPDMHDPDLLIRTGGDRRLSNFMLWRLAYTELVFRDEYWPDFSRECFEESLAEFATRRRRYGGD